jgi:competence protein ComEC
MAIEGEATLVIGGTMVDAKRTSPDQMMAASIESGETHHLSKGDVITIRAERPHWWKDVPTKTIAVHEMNVQSPSSSPKPTFVSFFCLFAMFACAGALRAQSRNLEIYWVDAEGGAATLVIAPSGESLLVDTGWEERDAKRIAAAAQQAGLKKIDYFVLSHYHPDHAGGIPALVKLIPIEKCFDRGDFVEPINQKWFDNYMGACRDKRTIVKAGDEIPLKGVQVEVVASNGQIIEKPVRGGGKTNSLCAAAENKPMDQAENQLMVSTLFTYGKFKFLDMADLDWEKEMELACPNNRLGEITVYQAGRHGALDGAGAPAFLYAIRPQAVIVNNGPRKGLGVPSSGAQKAQTMHYERLAKIPGVEGIWQGHLSLLDPHTGHNTDENMIANLEESADCKGNWIKASVAKDGSFTVTNGRNGFSRTYKARE